MASGEQAAPKPKPVLLDVEAAPPKAAGGPSATVTISNYAFLDDDEVVKVYVTLADELEAVVSDDVSVEWSARSLQLSVTTAKAVHRLFVSARATRNATMVVKQVEG